MKSKTRGTTKTTAARARDTKAEPRYPGFYWVKKVGGKEKHISFFDPLFANIKHRMFYLSSSDGQECWPFLVKEGYRRDVKRIKT
jgi:hypothetical protein